MSELKPGDRVRYEKHTSHALDDLAGREGVVLEVRHAGAYASVRVDWGSDTHFWVLAENLRKVEADFEIDWPAVAGKAVADKVNVERRAEALEEQIAQLHIDLDFERECNTQLSTDLEDMEGRLSALLCHVTDRRMSKPNYSARAMIQEADAASEREIDEVTADLTEELADAYKQIASLEQQRDAKADELDTLEDRLGTLADEWAATGKDLVARANRGANPYRQAVYLERGATQVALAETLRRVALGLEEARAA